MAKIPLRAYLKEIEGYIDQGEIELAISHAKNIIHSYPKQIDAYRLLGKAYLESQRYTEAADILQRVLSAIPDDFVSHIGMSIIREDEANFDASIWHMERAYEVQPFNPAVQDELRRLYGRRDGVEPPKIRLTRGALVRMYLRGELYSQAIAETRAALADDPQRYDLLVLLARLYKLSDQKFEATETASTLISKIPYCLEANQILSEILPGTSRAEDAKKFQQRIIALDPYSAFLSPSAPTSEMVPDQAVLVEQNIESPTAEGSQAPNWTNTIGVKWEEAEEETLPEWINESQEKPAVVETPSVTSQPPFIESEEGVEESAGQFEAADAEVLPDFMKDAGWIKADKSADEIMASAEETEAVVPAEIPEWLQSIAPDQSIVPGASEAERTDWLEDILPGLPLPTDQLPVGEPALESQEAEIPGWALAEEDSALSLEVESQAARQISPEEIQPAGIEDQIPEWMKEAAEETYPAPGISAEEQLGEITPSAIPESATQDLPGAPQAEQVPDWLLEFEKGEPSLEEIEQTVELTKESIVTANEIPDLEATGTAETEVSLEADQAPTEAPIEAGILDDADLAMAWLESLAARQGADEATLITPPEQRLDAPPDWVINEMQTGEISPVGEIQEQEESGLPLTELSDEVAPEEPAVLEPLGQDLAVEALLEELESEPSIPAAASESQSEELIKSLKEETLAEEAVTAESIDAGNLDEALAWLEGLAAKQGADEATLTTTPEQRLEVPPDWVLQEVESSEAEEEPALNAEEEPVDVSGIAIPAWLSEETEPEVSTRLTEEVPAVEPDIALPDWSVEESAPEVSAGLADETPAVEAEIAVPDWLSEETEPEVSTGLAGETTAVEAEIEVPDWSLEETEQKVSAGFTEETPAEIANIALPDWLSEAIEPEVSPEVEAETKAGMIEPVDAEPMVETLDEILTETPAEVSDTVEIISTLPEEVASAEEAVPVVEEQPTSEFTQSFSDWLGSLEEEEPASLEIEAWAAEQPTFAETAETEPVEPGKVTEWLEEVIPVETGGAKSPEPLQDWLGTLEEQAPQAEAEPEIPTRAQETPISGETAWEAVQPVEAVEPAPLQTASFIDLKEELGRGNIDVALTGLDQMIHNGENLPDTIQVLKDALYRFPVDISIWQLLGDAYSRNNQLQEALDAYTKAEELLR